VTVRDLIYSISGARRLPFLSRFRSVEPFSNSSRYWEQRYALGGTSGAGSYGSAAEAKAHFLNDFVRKHRLRSVIELGCGDGNVLSLNDYPAYIGLDISPTAIGLCQRRFASDPRKSFFVYNGHRFTDDSGNILRADLALSLDVIFHLVEDAVFDAYMEYLFEAGRRYIIIYATNEELHDDAPHVRHRNFSSWIDVNRPQWRLTQVHRGPVLADFFIYEPPDEPISEDSGRADQSVELA
jgi:SAM-dependent methyltransferase